MVRRNGSGKSSFAEGLEVLLTGNLRPGTPTQIDAQAADKFRVAITAADRLRLVMTAIRDTDSLFRPAGRVTRGLHKRPGQR